MPVKFSPRLPSDHFKLADPFHISRWMCSNCGLIFDYQFELETPGRPEYDFNYPEKGEFCSRCGIFFNENSLIPITVSKSPDEDSAASERAEHQHPYRLHKILMKCFNETELQTLCFRLDMEYDDLPGTGRENKARELIKYLERRQRLSELVEIGKELRPKESWD